MKRLVLLAVMLLGCLVVGGCSGLQARGPMVAKIDGNAKAALSVILRITETPMTDAEAVDYLNANAATFAEYANAKTVNWFAYAFGDKTIFVTGEYATRLDVAKVLSEETALRASLDPQPTNDWMNAAVKKECAVLVAIRDAKDGKGPGQ